MERNIIKIDEAGLKDDLKTLIRGTVEDTLNAMLDEEAADLCNAEKHERSEGRRNYRSGHYHRKLLTGAGELDIAVPKLRLAPFETAIIERYRRRESSVEESLIEMYLAGVSVRRIEDVTELLWGSRVSASTVSNLNQKVYGKIEEWRNRPLSGEYPYVFVDGIYLKRSWGGEMTSVSVLVAIGVNGDGYREILGAAEGASESKECWKSFLLSLKKRGLKGAPRTSTWASWNPHRRSSRMSSGSAVRFTSSGTCSRRCPATSSPQWPPSSRPPTPRRTARPR